MQKFTKQEIRWIMHELETAAAVALNASEMYPNMTGTEISLLRLKNENYADMYHKFKVALDKDDKRIAIN